MATTFCPKHGPLTAHDVVSEVEYDQAAGTIQTTRTCAMCGSPVTRGSNLDKLRELRNLHKTAAQKAPDQSFRGV